MRQNDVERAIDTTLSGLTVTQEQQSALIRAAMASRPPEEAKGVSPDNRVKLKFRFSLSFGLPHMVVAAIVVIVLMIAPIFAPGTRTNFTTWQSEDGEHYMVQGNGKETNQTAAEADVWPTEEGVFKCETIEEANAHFGTAVPIITWMSEGWTTNMYTVSVMGSMRSFTATYDRGEGERIVYSIFENRDGLSYMAVEQDGEGEYVTFSDGREVYVTTNIEWQSIAWIENDMQILLSTSLTREEAIRMAESVKIP